jgi:D-arabinose 1-dehydrogenase-like Zn-dependent alcohol dehydrogenase
MIRQSLVAHGAPLEETRTEPPRPRGSAVLLRVRACGVCHSDLHLQDGHLDLGDGKRLDMSGGRTLPFTLGHEISGFIEASGPDAGSLDRDTPYAVYAWIGCGECGLCGGGREQLCEAPRQIGIHADGGYASHVLVPHPRYLIDVSGIDELFAGSLMCAGLTAYAAVKKAMTQLDGRPLLIIGLGGVGLMALKVATTLKIATVIGADANDAKLASGLAEGANAVFHSADPDVRKEMRRRFGGLGAAIDFVGTPESMTLASGVLGKGAMLIVVGLFGGRFALPAPLFPLRELTIAGSYVGTLAEAREVVELARQGRLAPIPIRPRPLTEANDVLAALRAGGIVGRIALKP